MGDTPWDKGQHAPALDEILSRKGSEIWGNGTVLVPGCGTGHDVRRLARHGLSVLGVDLAPSAIARAEVHEAVGTESYELADFLDPEWSREKFFAAIWEHTCFCAISPSRRPDYAQACADLLEPGGDLVGVFFLTPNDPGEEDQGPPFNTSIAELDRHFAPWFERVDAWMPAS